MKCLLIAYINSEDIINDIENIMGYYNFDVIENNNHYRVFLGHFKGGAAKLVNKLNTELAEIDFNIEDSIFVVYPAISANDHPSISSMVIKRKGNKYLRQKFIS